MLRALPPFRGCGSRDRGLHRPPLTGVASTITLIKQRMRQMIRHEEALRGLQLYDCVGTGAIDQLSPALSVSLRLLATYEPNYVRGRTPLKKNTKRISCAALSPFLFVFIRE